MAKFKPGDNVIISKDSKNVWIRGKKGTIIRFLEEDNVPGSLYQWTYEIKLEDGDKSYVPQWEIELENSARHHCVFGYEQMAADLTGKSLLLQHRGVTGDSGYEEKYLSLILFRVHAKRATYYHTVKGAGTNFMIELKKEIIEALSTSGMWEGNTYRKGVKTKIMVL